MRQLDTLLTQLRQHGIKINLFGSKEVAYLGFHITVSSILPGADKLQEVQKTTLPTTIQQVQHFLGFFATFSRTMSATLPR